MSVNQSKGTKLISNESDCLLVRVLLVLWLIVPARALPCLESLGGTKHTDLRSDIYPKSYDPVIEPGIKRSILNGTRKMFIPASFKTRIEEVFGQK